MSKILEYMALVPKGIKNIRQIVDGIVNDTMLEQGRLPQEEVDIIIKRRLICATCPHMSKNAIDYKSDIDEEHCIWCTCFIKFKTANMDSVCGLKIYNQKYNKNVPLKW